nr:chorismate mutase [uncultured bacterium]
MSPEAKEHLLELRQKIDIVDLELLNALNQRAKLVMEVGKIKQKEQIEVLDKDREAELMKRLSEYNRGPLDEEMLQDLFLSIINILKRLQA